MSMNFNDGANKADDSWEPLERRSKRIKTNSGRALRAFTRPPKTPTTAGISLLSLLESPILELDFDKVLPKESYMTARLQLLSDSSELDPYKNKLRPLTLSEINDLRGWLENTAAAGRNTWTVGEAILKMRLKLRKVVKFENATFSYDALRQLQDQHYTLRIPTPPPSHSAPNEETLRALHSIRKTPYVSSFASRLLGTHGANEEHLHLIHRDWETCSPWMDLLSDIRLHYCLRNPDDEMPITIRAPIDYGSLRRTHLPQIHDLLSRIFWPGIDVSDSLQYSPAECTIVATYKRLVVGAAFLSSPEETYLTYLVVRPGWEDVNIASVMLYHLITANPKRDITLHVSANNPAMLLYNKFGFKAEEFIVGFYEDYLSKESKACKNAFRLRLRR